MNKPIQHNTLPKGCTTPGELVAQENACTNRVSLTTHDLEPAEASLAQLRSLGLPEGDLVKAADHATTHRSFVISALPSDGQGSTPLVDTRSTAPAGCSQPPANDGARKIAEAAVGGNGHKPAAAPEANGADASRNLSNGKNGADPHTSDSVSPPHPASSKRTFAARGFIEMMKIEGVPARLIIKVVRRGTALRSGSAESLCKRLSFIEGFLRANGQDPNSRVDCAFVEAALTQAATGTGPLELPPGTELDPACREHLRVFGRAAKALEEADFSATVMRKVKALQDITYAEISEKAGLVTTYIKTIFADRHRFPTNLKPENAVLLDSTLGANDEVLFSYVATDQQSAYDQQRTIVDEILARSRFGHVLSQMLLRRTGTVKALVKQVAAKSGIRLLNPQLYGWMQGRQVPSEPMRKAIETLDEILGARGELLKSWEGERPAHLLSKYYMSKSDWPERLSAQVRAVIDQNVSAVSLGKAEKEVSPRWSQSMVLTFEELCQAFFGFVHTIRKVHMDHLSLSLFADVELVKSFLDFQRGRSGQERYSSAVALQLSIILVLCRRHLPSLADSVETESHWQGRLRTRVVRRKKEEDDDGCIIRKEVVVELQGRERWDHQLGLAIKFARSLRERNKFDGEILLGDAAELLLERVPLWRIFDEYAKLVDALPILILSRKAAIVSRQLALAGLVLAENLHTDTLCRLRLDQMTITPGGSIHLKIGPDQFRRHNRSEVFKGIDKDVADIPGVRVALTRYLQEARPLIVDHQTDANLLFTARRLVPRNGQTPSGVSADVTLVLGYAPTAHRNLFLFYAFLHGVPLDLIAVSLHTTTTMIERTLKKFTLLKNEVASEVMSLLLKGKRDR